MSRLSQCQCPAPISHSQLQPHIMLWCIALGRLHVGCALLHAAVDHTADDSAAAGHCTIQILLQPICGLPSPLLCIVTRELMTTTLPKICVCSAPYTCFCGLPVDSLPVIVQQARVVSGG